MGISAEALIFKALALLEPRYQQSYSQKLWIEFKSFMNQGLKAFSASSHQQYALSWIRS
jgi:hypothetical protein